MIGAKKMEPISYPSDICGTQQATISSAQFYDCNNPITSQQCFETCVATDGCVAFQVTMMTHTAWTGHGNCADSGEQGYICTPQSACRVDTNHRWEFYRVVPTKKMEPISYPSDICGTKQATISSARFYDCNNPITAQQCFESCVATDNCVAFQVTKMTHRAWAGHGKCADSGEQGYICTPQSACRVDSNHRWEFYRVIDAEPVTSNTRRILAGRLMDLMSSRAGN
jgi:ribosomal protein L31